MSVEMLARCGLKTVRFDVGRGGVAELTASDIAMQLGMALRAGTVSEIASIFAVTHYTNIHSDKDADLIERYLKAQLYIKAKRENLPVQHINKIVELALKLATNSAVCPKCNGTLFVLKNKKFEKCNSCNGTGYAKVTKHKKAKFCGLYNAQKNTNSWTTKHDELLAYAEQIITSWIGQINHAIKQLFN